MNVYCELLLERIRVKIDGEEIAFQVPSDFYTTKMFRDSLTSARIRGYINYHKSDLNIFQLVRYYFKLNTVHVLVNHDIQELVTVRQIHDYASRFMDGKAIYIIPKPITFDSGILENIRSIRTEYINGRHHADTAVAKLKEITTHGVPERTTV
ncbi:MAG TPA: hypothetical protein VK666_07585 [Chryseolinea sp.]|nr:hypothetical protein [Chryseolinea sp.]